MSASYGGGFSAVTTFKERMAIPLAKREGGIWRIRRSRRKGTVGELRRRVVGGAKQFHRGQESYAPETMEH